MPVMVLFLAAAVVLSDQLIKIAVVQFLKPVGSVTAIPGLLDLVYVENTGAAFGLFADQRWVFIALTIIFVIVLIAVLFRLKITSKIYFTSMFLILGGAVGNLIDRIFNGFVVDYLQLSFFPPFLTGRKNVRKTKRKRKRLMSEPVELVLSEREEGIRLDKVLAERLPDLTRTAIQRLLEEEQVLINGKPAAKNRKGRAGDSVAVRIPDPEPLCLQAENVPLDIVYEDDDLLVVNKPQGMVVHPAPGNYQGTLVNALLAHCGNSLSGINGVIRPGIVHRIDKDTSGLLMVAKNDFAHQGLARQIKEHSFRREYEAVVIGRMKQESGVVNAPIGRHPIDRKKMAVTEKNSKEAVTYFRVIAEYPGYTHIRLRLETGRTHQIRVHMAYLGHPVAGDPVYGPRKPDLGLKGQCLHARLVGFVHPRDGRYLEFESPLPDYFTRLLTKLEQL